MTERPPPAPAPAPSSGDGLAAHNNAELLAFVSRVGQRVRDYLRPRTDNQEQTDHLRHVADRTRWLYYSELQRIKPGASVSIPPHDDALIEACVLSHDIGKWIPRDELQALIPGQLTDQAPVFRELKFTTNQSDLFLLGIRRRFALAKDGYTPEYDSAHHLVSAYLLATDQPLGFQRLAAADRERLIDMIVGHQFGGYFKESLLNLSLTDAEVTTGMLMDVARPDRVSGDLLASSFHDADISDLLFVGSLEARPNREPIFHAGGLVKILMINFTNLIYNAPNAPRNLAGCLRSCQGTVATAAKEFLTLTAIEHGQKWSREARRFLARFRQKTVEEKINRVLEAVDKPALERIAAARLLTQIQAREFLGEREEEE